MTVKLPVLVLHGISEGAESEFIKNIVTKAQQEKTPILAINFPYMQRGETSTSKGLQEEIQAIAEAIEQLAKENPGQIHIIAKSLGGIAASFYLDKTHDPRIRKLTLLGAVLGDLKMSGLRGIEVDVIQGQNDRFGSPEEVKKAFDSAGLPLHRLIEVEGGDHSYRDANKEPIHQNHAVEEIEF